ncbi:MAG: efflux RND transporter permease subunit [Planctomycetota bacterium]
MIALFLYRNPRLLLLVGFVLVAAGAGAVVALPRLEDPVLGKRIGVVSVAYPGANAAKVESLVAVKLEEALQPVPEIGELRSNSRTGMVNVVLKLRDRVDDIDAVWTRVRELVDAAAADLPEECLEPEMEVVPLKAFAAIVAVRPSEQDGEITPRVRKRAALLASRLRSQFGSERVDLIGDPGEEISVELMPEVLASLGTSTGAIAGQIRDADPSTPAGYLRGDQQALLIALGSDQPPASRVAQTRLRLRGADVAVADIALVQRQTASPPAEMAFADGAAALFLGVLVDDGLRIDAWTAGFQRRIEQFEAEYGDEVSVETLFLQQDYIRSRLGGLMRSLGLSGLGVLCVVLLLMGWRCMLVVGLTLPFSCLAVLTGLRALGVPLHQMSVTGLIVALGLLIDNAIVIVEDIRARMSRGAPTAAAIGAGVRHLSMPLFASTLTTAAAFLPIATLPGPPGEFVGSIAVSVILAITASFLLAMSVVPALLGLLSDDAPGTGRWGGLRNQTLEKVYQWVLRVLFRVPLLGVMAGLALPLIGLACAPLLPKQFFPPSGRNQVHVELELPAQQPIDATLAAVRAIDRTIRAEQGIEHAHWFLGRSAATFYYNVVPRRRGTPFYAQAFLDVTPGANTTALVNALQSAVDRRHLSGRVVVRLLDQGPPIDAPIEIRVAGPDPATLQQLGSRLRLVLTQTPDVLHTRSDMEETVPLLSLDLDPQESAVVRQDEQRVAQFLYTSLEGAPAGTVFDGGEELPVHVRMAPLGSERLARLAALPLPPAGPPQGLPAMPRGGPRPQPKAPSPLASVARLRLTSDFAAITRVNGQHVNEVKAYTRAGVLPGAVLDDFRSRLAQSGFELPPGYALTFEGEAGERSRAVRNLLLNAVLLFSLMILTLVAVFGSFRCAAIVLAVGALTVGLGPLSLWVFGYPFGFMAIVGTMGLVGVAINDSIVVLAAIRDDPSARGGNGRALAAVVSGCTRHILATTVTTVIGFAPLVLGGGGFWPPLAITVAGGVAGATALALFFVPCLYRCLVQSAEV